MPGKSPIHARPPINGISRTPTSRLATGNTGREAALFVPQSSGAPVSLRYVRTAPMRVTGEASGRHYEFSGSRPTQAIDPKDVLQLLSMGYFSKA